MKKIEVLFLVAIMTLLSAVSAHAAGNAAVEKATNRLLTENPGVELVYSNSDSPSPAMLSKLKVAIDNKSTPEKAAFEFIRKHQAVFGMHDAASELKTAKTVQTRKNTVYRFTQHLNGVPVENSEMRVVINNGSLITRVYNQYSTLDTISTVPSVNYRDAIATAWKNVYGIQASQLSYDKLDSRTTELLIRKIGNKTSLVYKIALPLPLLTERRVAWVDAHSGQFIKSENMVKYANEVDAWMYNPGFDGNQSLVRTQINEVLPDQNLLVGRTHEVTGCPNQGETINVMGLIELPVCSQVALAEADSNGDFLFTPMDTHNSGFSAAGSTEDEFPEAHMYYHVENIYDYYVNLARHINADDPPFVDLGMVSQGNKLKCIVNFQTIDLSDLGSLLNPGVKPLVAFDNAFFSPAQGGIMEQFIPGDAIVFGQGSEFDFSYDADIIYHEFTHAVIDTLTSLSATLIDAYGLRNDPGSMNEGFADFFAATVTDTPGLGEYSGPYLMNKANEPMRSALNDHTVNKNIIGEIHEDSLPWSAALWAIREHFKGPRFSNSRHIDVDAAILSAIVEAPQECTFDVMSHAIADQIGEWFDSQRDTTAHDLAISEFTQRGLIGSNRARPFEKGETLQMAGAASTNDLSPYTPGFFQIKLEVPAGQKELFFEYSIVASGGMGGSSATVRFFAKKNAPVLFQYAQNGNVSNDALLTATAKKSDSQHQQLDRFIVSIHNEDESELEAGDWYVAIGVSGGGSMLSAGTTLYLLKADYSDRITCELNSHCDKCFTCSDKECLPVEPECDSDDDCAAGKFCDANSCYSCQPVPAECKTALDCEACEKCEGGSCVAIPSECEIDSDCDEGFHCEVGTCGGKCKEGSITDGDEAVDGDESSAGCKNKDDCGECQICVQGACIDIKDECSDDEDCDIGKECVEGDCGKVCQDVGGGDADTPDDDKNGASDGSSGGCNGAGLPFGLLLSAAFACTAFVRRKSAKK